MQVVLGVQVGQASVIAVVLAVPAVIESAIAALVTRLRWAIAADLAVGRAATVGAVPVPAACAAHPAWEVTVEVEGGADLAVAVCEAVAAAWRGGGGRRR